MFTIRFDELGSKAVDAYPNAKFCPFLAPWTRKDDGDPFVAGRLADPACAMMSEPAAAIPL